ncbi:MAG: DUF6788 family protein [Dermatophilaceae bacterium]
MTPHSDLPDLEQQRSRLHAGLAAVGDFRPGSLSAVMRRCGKPRCACADPAHPGHGPQHILTKKVAGKTVAVHLKSGTELDKVTGEVANYKRFKQIVVQIVEVNEAICEARPISAFADDGQPPTQPVGERGALLRAPGGVRRRGSPPRRAGGRLARRPRRAGSGRGGAGDHRPR